MGCLLSRPTDRFGVPGDSNSAGSSGSQRDGAQPDGSLGEIYLEMRQVGKAQRITAIDPDTCLEVIFTAPTNTPRNEIETLARNKLAARIARERAKAASVVQPVRAERGRLV